MQQVDSRYNWNSFHHRYSGEFDDLSWIKSRDESFYFRKFSYMNLLRMRCIFQEISVAGTMFKLEGGRIPALDLSQVGGRGISQGNITMSK